MEDHYLLLLQECLQVCTTLLDLTAIVSLLVAHLRVILLLLLYLSLTRTVFLGHAVFFIHDNVSNQKSELSDDSDCGFMIVCVC